MKTTLITKIAALVFVPLLLSSCLHSLSFPPAVYSDAPPSQGAVRVSVSVNAGEGGVRSSAGEDSFTRKWESEVRNFTIFQCRNGVLETALYSSSGNIEVSMLPGYKYHFYALVNCGDKTSLLDIGAKEEILTSSIVSIPAFGEMVSWGMPMAGYVEKEHTASTITIPVDRLCSKIRFSVGNATSRGKIMLEHGTFVFSSLCLRQVAQRIRPFNSGFAEDVADSLSLGDSLVAQDILALNCGENTQLYCLENEQGIFEGEERVPSEMGARSALCTYIEGRGRYTDLSGALQADVLLRLYPGKTAADFNISRNTVRNIVLTLTDTHGYLYSSWQMESEVKDARTLSFGSSSYEVISSSATAIDLLCNGLSARGNPDIYAAFNLKFTLSANLSAAGIRFDGETLQLTVDNPPPADVYGTLKAVSWDGRQSAMTTILIRRSLDFGYDDDSNPTHGSGQIDY